MRKHTTLLFTLTISTTAQCQMWTGSSFWNSSFQDYIWLMRRHGRPQELLAIFYTDTTESILCTSISVWFEAGKKQDKYRLHWNIGTAEKKKSSLHAGLVYSGRIGKEAENNVKDPTHPAHITLSWTTSPLAGTTDPCAQTQPDTRTDSSHCHHSVDKLGYPLFGHHPLLQLMKYLQLIPICILHIYYCNTVSWIQY